MTSYNRRARRHRSCRSASNQAMSLVDVSAEGKALMTEKNFDKGWVAFGNRASEQTVKVATALACVGKTECWVEISFDDKPLAAASVGVRSKEWALLSGGRAQMPGLAINGTLYMDAVEIVKMLATCGGDEPAPAEVMELIELSRTNNETLLEACKHWGWAGLHESMGYTMVNKAHYEAYGAGKKDMEWERLTVQKVDAFLSRLEEKLAARGVVNGYYVGDSLTLADCALFNWPLSLSGIAGLEVAKKFPKVWANWEKLKELRPAGSEAFLDGFPGFCGYVQGAMQEVRGQGFDINFFYETQ